MSQDPTPDRWEDAVVRLFPTLRRATEPPGAWLAGRERAENRLVARPFVPLVRELFAVDLPEVRLFVNAGHLTRWGVDEDAVAHVAHANLATLATRGLRHREEYGLWQLDAGDGYEASRLVLPQWLASFKVEGRPVAIAPTPRVLLVGGDGDAAQLERLVAIAEAVLARAEAPLAGVPMTVGGDGRVRPLELADDHPLADRLTALRATFAARVLAEQAEELRQDASLGASVADVELADEGVGGAAWTVATWQRAERPTLLPVVDFVVLREPGASDLLVSWENLERHARGCLEPTDLDPPRVRARWPGRAALAELRRDSA